MDMEKNERSKSFLKFIIPIVILAIIIGLIGFAYAKYQTSLTGQAEEQIAKWNFKVTANSKENLNIDLAETRFENDTTEVDRAKVAPGTAGELILNVDATGSEVSLTYDIDIDISNVPENLIFYSDSEMKNAIYKENEKININGFFMHNETQTKSIPIYWSWAIETGTTEQEINENDIKDSRWMGKQITIGVEAIGKQFMDNPTTQYAVTFDANGGTLQGYGNSSQTTKYVNSGDEYGELPIPTRDGYTFKGWNGKNLWNSANIKRSMSSNENTVIINDNKVIFNLKNSTNTTSQYIKFQLWGDNFISESQRKTYKDGYTYYSFTKEAEHKYIRIAMNGDKVDAGIIFHIEHLKNDTIYTISYNVDVYEKWYAEISNIQLEEGATPTEYEPHFVTDSTKVATNTNHTLTAIWEKNE